MLRIGLQTWGSEGDIRPFVALGHALVTRGHEVELLYTEISDRRYEDVARSLGFTARSVASPVIKEPEELFAIGLKAIHTRNQLRQGLLISRTMIEPAVEAMYQAAVDLCSRSDLVIHHFILHPARAAAELTGTPAITLTFAPMLTPSRYIHPRGLPKLGEWGNVVGWKIAAFAINQTLLRNANELRTRSGLPPLGDLMHDGWPSRRLNLMASSPALLDRPRDWPAWHQFCGFLELPAHEHETASADVEAFLRVGPPPVFMGFGSLMPTSGPHLAEAVATFEKTARLAGCRAIVQAEVDGSLLEPGASSDRVLFVRRAPHRQVFPRCAAVVHHAGAGTTHSTLRAGVPSIAVPHVSDQFAWSDELQRLGVAPSPIRRSKLTAGGLASRITEVLSRPDMKAAAMAIGARMRSDNGPERAVDLIEAAMRPPSPA